MNNPFRHPIDYGIGFATIADPESGFRISPIEISILVFGFASPLVAFATLAGLLPETFGLLASTCMTAIAACLFAIDLYRFHRA